MDDFTKKRIKKIMDKYIENKIPKHIQNEIKMTYKIRGNSVTLIEERPAFMSDIWVQHKIAQFRLDNEEWKIYWQDSKDRWHFVEDIKPSNDFQEQLEIVDKDKRGTFWG